MPGKYTVEVIKENYDTVKIDSVEVIDGIPTILNIKLKKFGIIDTISQYEPQYFIKSKSGIYFIKSHTPIYNTKIIIIKK